MRSLPQTALLVGITSAVVLLSACASVGAVPDARLTIEEVGVSDDRPSPGEMVNVSITVSNSGGSTDAVEVDRLYLRERGGGPFDSVDRATAVARSGVGALSPGDTVTVDLVTSFEEVGFKRLEAYVRATSQGEGTDGTVTAAKPVNFFVGSVDVQRPEGDVGVDATLVERPSGEEDGAEGGQGEQVGGINIGNVLGGGGIGGGGVGSGSLGQDEEPPTVDAFEVRVTNFGNVEARDVYVTPSVDGQSLPRIAVGSLAPFGVETVSLEPSRIGTSTYSFEVTYTAAGETGTATRSVEYDPAVANLTVTDVSMQREGDTIVLSGNVGNTGRADARGTTVSVGDSGDGVSPTYPSANSFIGTVPGSEFTFFELTAEVDKAADSIPVEVRYSFDGTDRRETFPLRIDTGSDVTGTEAGGGGEEGGGGGGEPAFSALIGLALLVPLVSAVAVYLRRRGGRRVEDGNGGKG